MSAPHTVLQRIARLALILTMGVSMSACSDTDVGVSQCPVDTIPIQIVSDTRNGPETTLSAAELSDSNPHFRAFATAVTKHIAARLAKDKLCLDSADSKKQSLLQFANWRLVENPILAQPLSARPSSGCRITSPWIDLAIERKPIPWVRGIVRWNERQLLVDQAVLAGAKNVPPGVAMPLEEREFQRFMSDYLNSEVLYTSSPARPIEERIPPDILWLFRFAMPNIGTHYEARFHILTENAMRNVLKTNAENYTKHVIALIDRCFDTDRAEIHYKNILDISDLVPLEQYKIDMPTHSFIR